MTGLILFLIAIAFLLRIDFIFYIAYVCIGVYAWSRWYLPRAFVRLTGKRSFTSHAFWGEVVTVTLHIGNPNRLGLPWVQVNESIAVELRQNQQIHDVLSLPRRGTVDLTYTIKAARRGYYQIGPLRLLTSDLFGLIPEQQAYLPPDYITIYPRITPLSQLRLPSRLPFGTIASKQRLFADPTRPMGVRDYRSGDSLRQINWKVSAHARNLVVKVEEAAISLETAVLLNLHASDYSQRDRDFYIEWGIEVAASLAAHLIEQRQPVGLITNGVDPLHKQTATNGPSFDEASGRLQYDPTVTTTPLSRIPPIIPPHNGRAHLMKILERLARIEADETMALTAWLPTACLGLHWGITILVITAHGDESACNSLHRLVRTGYNPVLITVEPDYNFGLVRERARRLGFAAYNVTQAHNMENWRRPLPTI
ncbi:MAG: DUF58 domain-containing protein [Anaerolinea sp.]|nr:DUF58 domain-containing protein [Anaerolinea sp.]